VKLDFVVKNETYEGPRLTSLPEKAYFIFDTWTKEDLYCSIWISWWHGTVAEKLVEQTGVIGVKN